MAKATLPSEKTQATAPAKPVNYTFWTVILLLMLVAFVIASVKAQHGGWLMGEADLFLVDHMDPDRPFLSKVLAPHVHHASQYQARELSTFFDHFDARFINWCVQRKMPHFMSIMSFIFLTALCLIHWRYATKYLR